MDEKFWFRNIAMNYEEQLKKLTPDRKLELWSKYKDSTLSKGSKYRAIYYDAKALKYL